MTQQNIRTSNPNTYESHELDMSSSLALAPELRTRNMFCLHGIAGDDLGLNSLLPENTELEERFRIAIVDRPALSAEAHTHRAVTSKAPLWSTIGVMIGGGTLQAASPRDMSSRMLRYGQRQTLQQSMDDINQALDKIIANDEKYPNYPLHNEVVVSGPTVSALYFKDTSGLMINEINRKQVTAEPNTVPEIIRTVGAQFGLPIFAVRTSGVYEVKEFDADTGMYQFSAETTPRVYVAESIHCRLPNSDHITFGGAIAVQKASEDS
jgi:hypothetical protein